MTPIDLDSPEFMSLIADALEHIWDFSYLGKHPLTKLNTVIEQMPRKTRISHIDYGRALGEVLQAAIESIKPADKKKHWSWEARYYAVLLKTYLEGDNNRAVAHSLGISERTLYRYRVKAIRLVTEVVHDWES